MIVVQLRGRTIEGAALPFGSAQGKKGRLYARKKKKTPAGRRRYKWGEAKMREREGAAQAGDGAKIEERYSTARPRAPKSSAKKKRGRSRRDDTWWVWVRVEIEDAAPSAPLGVKRDGGTKAEDGKEQRKERV